MRLVLPLALVAACAGVRVVDRADDGTPILLCGGQPDVGRLKEMHARHGIRTVVNLRGERPGASWFRNERNGVQAIGARWIHLPVSSHEAPSPDVQRAFFAIVEDPERWPVYVHCESGMHRTGLLCGLYRLQYQGWTAEEAITEMRRNGFDFRGDRPAAKAFLRGYEPDPARTIDRSRSRAAGTSDLPGVGSGESAAYHGAVRDPSRNAGRQRRKTCRSPPGTS